MTTPARRQYLEIKERHPDALLMYQVGDFFEFFDEDARVAARALQLVLTSRAYGPDERVPLAGVPVHALDTYAGRLVAQGYTVAICEQVEPPGRGLVRRDVTRVLSPGTVVEPGLVPTARDNYLAAVAWGRAGARRIAGLAYIEASTGVFACTQWAAEALPEDLRAELQRLTPAEVLVAQTNPPSPAGDPLAWAENLPLTPCPPHYFDYDSAYLRLCRHFATSTLASFGCEDQPVACAAAGAILAYLEHMNPALLSLASGLTTYHTNRYVQVDGRTWSALEAVEPARGSASGATLLKTLDATRTPMGARTLRRLLLQPLRDSSAIESRLDAVSTLYAHADVRETLGTLLDGLPDVERLVARVMQATAQPRDLHTLAATLLRVPELQRALAGHRAGALGDDTSHLDPCADVVRLIEHALQPPGADDGRILRRGYSADLDDLIESVSASRRWIANLEVVERARTGIKSLHVTYNQVFGYSIQVSRAGLARVPPEYERKQTMANGERFITHELKEHEARILQAEDRIASLERELYAEALGRVAAHHARLRRTATALARLDVWLALAEVAIVRGYVRPTLTDDLSIEIRAGRHPVVESALDGGAFIPNDTLLGGADGDPAVPTNGQILLLTGPNMAGKSTYLRQVAQIVLLAQIGSFVPASHARIGIVDRLFTRVGADDDLARGISTFMREMTETAFILRHATERSLIILDEVGRGTSTHDGLAIARAVVEYLHDRVGARTLFATHFHELADAAASLPRVRLAAMDVREQDGQVIFLHRLKPGRAHHSYGVHVARMAGLPRSVTTRAAELLATQSASAPDRAADAADAAAPRVAPSRRSRRALARLAAAPLDDHSLADQSAVVRGLMLGLASLNVAAMTPMEAINVLFSLQQRAAELMRAPSS